MAESLSVKFGRIAHDLFLINSINNARQQYSLASMNRNYSPEEIKEFDIGWKRQQDTLYKATVRRILGESNKGQSINVSDNAFIITLPSSINGILTIYIAGGILDVVYLASFPAGTALQLLSPLGPQMFYNVGGIHHANRKVTKSKAKII